MISAQPHTNTSETVPSGRDDLVKQSSPDPVPPARRQEFFDLLGTKDLATLLYWIWDRDGYHSTAYLQAVVAGIRHNRDTTGLSSKNLFEKYIPDGAVDKLPPITKIGSDEDPMLNVGVYKDYYLETDSWKTQGLEVLLGPIASLLEERLTDHGIADVDPKALAEATRPLVESDDITDLITLKKHHTQPHRGTADGTGTAGTAGADRAADAATAANDVKSTVCLGLWATPPMPRLSAYRGRFNVPVTAIMGRNVASPRRNVASPNGGSEEENEGSEEKSGRSQAGLDVVPIETEQELLDRSPLGDKVPYVSFPTEEVYEPIIQWRPILEDLEPLAAMLQLILISDKRDDEYNPTQPCTGMPIWHKLVLAAFGFTSRQHARDEAGVSTGQLLDLYRKYVDSDFHVSGWSKEEGRARIVLAHSIPESIINLVEEHMLGPEEPDDTTYLITGLSADRGNNWEDHEERVQEVEDRETEIPIPGFTERMQSYLHSLTEKSFSHGGYGYVGANIEKAFEAARGEFKDAQRRHQVLRKLCMIRQYPKPLYPGCDYSPRITAEGHNQLMNLPSTILRTLYTDRDREMDLSKAHLATTVPLARKNGIDAAVLEEHLDRNLNNDSYDLWMDVASYFDVEYKAGARTAAKKLYTAPYGGSKQEVLKQMCFAYADAGGMQLGYEPFKPVLEHPLVDELFRIREEIHEVIKDRGYLVDAAGRKIRPEMMTHKDEGDRWKPVMAYTNASFEQKLMYQPFKLAAEEQKRDRPRFTIWLYQSDGITVRFSSRASTSHQVERLQDAVAEEAEDRGIPTELEVDWAA